MSFNPARRIRRHGYVDMQTRMRRVPDQVRRKMMPSAATPADEGEFEARLDKRRSANKKAKASRKINR